jgi:acetylornithine/N-succinyldiaminopimelate aminotransferase
MLAMAAVTATLEAIENDRMLANVRAVEAHLRQRLREVEPVVAVHGLGLLLGIEFNDKAQPIHQALLERKIITGTSSNPKVLRLLPPLCLQQEHVDQFVDALLCIC